MGGAPISSQYSGDQMYENTMVPKRLFGDTDLKVSKLCLGGGSFLSTDSQTLIEKALKHGVDFWEIVSFTGKIYGDYFRKHPGIREKVFLSGKVYSTDPDIMQKQLDKVLNENGTSFIDFLAIHAIDDIKVLTNDVKKWADKVKNQKKIKYFGFCTHRNMDKCLSQGAELGWIDGIQTAYNYRLQKINSMEEAIQKCHEKGIGIFAVKSMGLTVHHKNGPEKFSIEDRLNNLLSIRNISFEQAKLKTIWKNPYVTSICSLMPNQKILQSNVSAAIDGSLLDAEINEILSEYADLTGKYYCMRCGLCETKKSGNVPIFDVIEMLMYSRGYGMNESIAKKFQQIPPEIRARINSSDYSNSEKICPQKMPIGQLMKEAYDQFSK
jgi:predicted aldo/keto reductase-like oxidoreductase